MDTEQRTRPPKSSPAPPPEREIDSASLLGAGTEIRIRHSDVVYTLRRTRQGKLILTK
jgi:hemin uptake protein HemP